MRRSAWMVLLILACLCLCPGQGNGFSWNPFSSSSSSSGSANNRPPMMELDGTVADFSMDGTNHPRGLELLENAWNKLAVPMNCWQDAYRNLFTSYGDEERKARLAWHLSSCYQADSGRPSFPSCAGGSSMVHCRKRLNESESKVFQEFFLETNTLCHQLQAEAFKHSTERLVNDLTRSSKSAEEKLEVIEDKSEQIIKESGKVQKAILSIEAQTERLAETSKSVATQINDVLVHSKEISDQSKEIAASQAMLKEGQAEMRDKIDAGMERIQESYESLGIGMDKLKEEAVDIHKAIRSVGDSMSSKMQDLQGTADEIGSVTGRSLENQAQLLDGQRKAMEGLNSLYSFQSQALEESREAMEKFAQSGQRQQAELVSSLFRAFSNSSSPRGWLVPSMEKSATVPSSSIIGGRLFADPDEEDEDEKGFHEKPLPCPGHRHRQARISNTIHALLLIARSICRCPVHLAAAGGGSRTGVY